MKIKESLGNLFGEFKTFILKGNVLDLAVGVIIGAAFKAIVDSMVGDIINPIVSFISHARLEPGHSYESDIWKGVGKFFGAILNFLLNAAIIFFIFVKPVNKLKALVAARPAEAAPVPDDVRLLTEIRDLLQRQVSGERPVAPPTPLIHTS